MTQLARRILAIALLLAMVGACTSRAGAADSLDQQRSLASALSSLNSHGVAFTISSTVTETKGQNSAQLTLSGTGLLKNDIVHMNLTETSAQGHGPVESVMIGDQILNRTSPSEPWSGNYLIPTWVPSARIGLAREAVLLTPRLGSSVFTHVSGGFVDKHQVPLAPAQLEEFSGMLVAGSSETDFLRTASGEVDVFTAWRSDKVLRVEVRFSYVDPGANNARLNVDSFIDVSSATVKSVPIPKDLPIQPTS